MDGAAEYMEDAIYGYFPIDLSKPISSTVDKVPIASATYTYLTNYDTFRDREIYKDKGKVEEFQETDKNVPELYNVIGEMFAKADPETGKLKGGVSPKRLQAAAEKVFTSPSNNPLVAFLYDGTDGILQDEETKKAYRKGFMERLGNNLSRKIIGSVQPGWDAKDKAKEWRKEVGGERKEQNERIKTLSEIDKDLPSNKMSDEAKEYVKSLPKEDQKRAVKYYKGLRKTKGAASDLLQIRFERNPEVRARMFVERFGFPDDEGMKEVNDILKTVGKIPYGTKFRAEYNRLKAEHEKEMKSKN